MQSADPPPAVIAVGDPSRPLVRRAIISTLLAAAFFSVTTGPLKQVKVLYVHAPWVNDPYDTAVSFAMLFVPFLAACCLGRVLLCRTAAELPAARVTDLLRGCRAVLGLIVITLLAQWAALALGANAAHWNGATWAQVGVVAVTTVLAAKALADMRRAPSPRPAGLWLATRPAGTPPADWLADVVVLMTEHSGRFGPFARPVLAGLAVADRRVVAPVRRHPVLAAVACAGGTGLVIGGWQALREGYAVAPALLTIALLACGCFALLTGAGGYLGLVRCESALAGPARRVLDASVVTCLAVLAVLAFRNSLWWIVGSDAAGAGVRQFALLLAVAALASFAVVLSAETVLGSHAARR